MPAQNTKKMERVWNTTCAWDAIAQLNNELLVQIQGEYESQSHNPEELLHVVNPHKGYVSTYCTQMRFRLIVYKGFNSTNIRNCDSAYVPF
jgi:hypothetical protein